MNEPSQREMLILEAALKLPPKARAAYLDQACGGDAQLRERIVQAICAASEKTGAAPQTPPTTAASTVIVPPIFNPPGEKTGDLIGRYKLLEKLGEGGMGSVWVAEQRQELHRKVALKVIKLGMDTKQVIARFEAERQALALMDHPGIARVLDAGATENGRPFFVMELVNGISITDYCDRHQLPTSQRLALFIKVCKALQHAHAKGIVHRDIKPQNILVTVQDNVPTPKIIDFGIAKALAGQWLTDKTVHTQLEEFIGTPAYMSPEQAEMNALGIDARSDIYSLGVLLYELLTGLTPFKAWLLARLSPAEIRRIIREEEPPRPSTSLTTLLSAEERASVAKHRNCEVPTLIHLVRGDLDWIAMKCLEKDRTGRYVTAEELASDVQRHLDSQPILARPPSQFHRLTKLVRRRKRTLAVALAVLLLTPLMALLLASFWPAMFQRRVSIEERLQRAEKLLRNYDQQGRIPGALTTLKEAARTDPANAPVWAKLGWANWLLYGEDEREETRWEAYRCSSNALRLNPQNPEGHLVQGLVARNLGDWPTATNHLLRAKELTRSSDGLILISLASACQSARDAPNAKSYAQLAEQAAGDHWDVWHRIGVFHYKAEPRNRDLKRARVSLERAVQLAPDSPMAHRHLGYILLLQQSPDEALKEFGQSLKLRSMPETLSAIGSVHYAKREYAAGGDYFSQASRADPSKYNYHVNAGLAFRKSGNAQTQAEEQFTQALRQTQDRLSAGGENALVRAHQGLCRAALAQDQAARRDLEQAQNEAGVDMNVLRIVYDGYQMLGDANRAAEVEQLMQPKQASVNTNR